MSGGPYQARYGNNWREEVVERLGRDSDAVRSVTDLIDHTIEEGNRVFSDTPFADCWMIYHDAISLWWSKGTQRYIESKGFRHRQVKSLDFTNTSTYPLVM